MQDGAGAKEPSEQMVVQPDSVGLAEDSLTLEEQKILQHPKGLKEMNMQLPDGMQAQLEQLLNKE